MTPSTTSRKGILKPHQGASAFTLQRFEPHVTLAPFVETYWVVAWDLGDGSHTQQVLPHPSVNLVFEPQARIYGVDRRIFTRRLTGRARVVGVKFRPGAFHTFHPVPQHHMLDAVLPARDVFGPAVDTLAHGLTGDTPANVAAVDAWLRARAPAEDAMLALVRRAITHMVASPATTRVEDVAQHLRLTVRALQRLFRQRVGVTPKWILQRHRMFEAAARLSSGPAGDWTTLALELGYFDQAHFIKDFRAALGCTPAQYARACAAPPHQPAATAAARGLATAAAGNR
jgi:AraC-like DNA-binding protein